MFIRLQQTNKKQTEVINQLETQVATLELEKMHLNVKSGSNQSNAKISNNKSSTHRKSLTSNNSHVEEVEISDEDDNIHNISRSSQNFIYSQPVVNRHNKPIDYSTHELSSYEDNNLDDNDQDNENNVNDNNDGNDSYDDYGDDQSLVEYGTTEIKKNDQSNNYLAMNSTLNHSEINIQNTPTINSTSTSINNVLLSNTIVIPTTPNKNTNINTSASYKRSSDSQFSSNNLTSKQQQEQQQQVSNERHEDFNSKITYNPNRYSPSSSLNQSSDLNRKSVLPQSSTKVEPVQNGFSSSIEKPKGILD